LRLFYSVFGLGLQADRPLAGLSARPDLSAIDVEMRLEGLPRWLHHLSKGPPILWYESTSYDRYGEPVLRVWRLASGAYFWLRYSDGIEFVIDRPGTRVWAGRPERATLEDLSTYLLGPIIGFVLRLRGHMCLHASAVAVGSQAIALLGPPGAGKSTTAAAFARLGYPALTDDITPLKEQENGFLAIPGCPRLCLWPESVTHLFGSPEALPRLTPVDAIDPSWDKRFLDLSTTEDLFQCHPLPLTALYILGDRSEAAGPQVRPLKPGPGILSLVANAYMNYLPDREMRAQDFARLSRVAATVPLRQVTPHSDPARIFDLCRLILADFRSLSATVPRRGTA
jgi:hypothetical protein